MLLAMLALPAAAQSPVVVELFTSQGCSSCPPADDLLRDLVRDPKLRGKVIPLAFHVDYWNHLGWSDPFSSKKWSARQFSYGRAFKLNGAYTPQMVVDGQTQFVGSNAGALHAAIEQASKRKRDAKVALRIDGADVVVNATATGQADLIVVAFENGVATKIERGENGGRTQVSDAIVRDLRVLGPIKGGREDRLALDLRPSMGVAALVQDRATMRIEAAAVAYAR
jgi:hypothetical protein